MNKRTRMGAAIDCTVILLAFIGVVATLETSRLSAVIWILIALSQLVRLADRCNNPKNWIVAIFAALFLCSCQSPAVKESLTTALAGQSAEAGARAWLTAHPEHREAFQLVATDTRQSTNAALALASLPTDALQGPNGAVYVSEPNILVHDGRRATVADVATRKATVAGLRRALVPMPPAPVRPVRAKHAQAHAITEVDARGRTNLSGRYTLELNPGQPTNGLPILRLMGNDGKPLVAAPEGATGHAAGSGPAATIPPGKSSPRVGVYRVEKKVGEEWVEVQSFTSEPRAEWRVKRIR